jgi:thiol:disulfide interchange protein DsbD
MLRLIALLGALALAAPAAAVESAPVRSPRATATLVADAAAVAPGESFRAGLRLQLAPGWHSYWRNAGDAGAPTEITLSLPPGPRPGRSPGRRRSASSTARWSISATGARCCCRSR